MHGGTLACLSTFAGLLRGLGKLGVGNLGLKRSARRARVASPKVLPPVLSLFGRGAAGHRSAVPHTENSPRPLRSLNWPAKKWWLGEPSTREGRRLLLVTSAQGAVDISVPEVGETQ